VGTIINSGYRFVLPPRFGRPGVYRFTNPDPVAHDGVIYRLASGKAAGDLVRWIDAAATAVRRSSSLDHSAGRV
jgi:hypothetical protein